MNNEKKVSGIYIRVSTQDYRLWNKWELKPYCWRYFNKKRYWLYK